MTTTSTHQDPQGLKRSADDGNNNNNNNNVVQNKKIKGDDEEVGTDKLILELAQYIESHTVTGKTFCSGKISSLPDITVPAAPDFNCTFPLKESEFNKLLSAGEVAPYGKDEKTVVDTEVRNCKQISDFTIKNEADFSNKLKKTVADLICPILTPSLNSIEIQLYKLLLYGKGSFFKPHRDTPRGERHFGSLVVVPPCKHSGGDLRVKHGDDEEIFNFSSSAKTKCQFVAFFSDCEHEITQLTKGFRISLVYHLFRPEGAPSLPPPITPAEDPIIQLLHKLRNIQDEYKPLEVAYLLDHKYTATSLNPASLKGKDLNFFNLVSGFQPRINGIELRISGVGSDDSPGRNIKLEYIMDKHNAVDIDEVDVIPPDAEKLRPTRIIKDSDYDKKKTPKVSFLLSTGIVKHVSKMRQMEKHISGTGNEGCPFACKYMHGAIFIPIKGDGNKDPFTIANARRELEVPCW